MPSMLSSITALDGGSQPSPRLLHVCHLCVQEERVGEGEDVVGDAGGRGEGRGGAHHPQAPVQGQQQQQDH